MSFLKIEKIKDEKIPKSIPKKFHPFIYAIAYDDGFDELVHKNGEAWDCFTVGLSDSDGCHTIIEHRLVDVVSKLREMEPCDCTECKWTLKQLKKGAKNG